MTFTADEDIQESMKNDKIGSRKKSDWINDKIKKGLLYEKKPEEIITSRSKGEIIGVEIP